MTRQTASAVGLALATMLACACTSHRVTVDPIEVKPIHMTVDINIKIDRELDQFFAFEEKLEPVNAPAPSAPATNAPAPTAPAMQGGPL